MDSLVRWTTNLDVQELTLFPDTMSMSPLTIAPMMRNRSLASLDLENITITDSLSKVFDNVRLTSIRLNWVSLSKDCDRWGQVFDSLYNMAGLKPRELDALYYYDVANYRYHDGLCTPFDADKCALKRFADRHKEYKGRSAWFCHCLDYV